MTEPRTTSRLTADRFGLAEAGTILRRGGLVAFPTETVYGLGADATNGLAVAGIYAAKGRPSFNPLIVHVATLEEAFSLGSFDPVARALAERFWPGPLTLVVPAKANQVSDIARAGLDSVAIRVPGHGLARSIIEAAGRPIAAPSANRSGRISPTSAGDVLADLDGAIDAVLMGDPARIGVESTILSCLSGGLRLLRPGGVSREEIEAALGHRLPMVHGEADDPTRPVAPGLLLSHYAPSARVRLNATALSPGEAALLFGGEPLTGLEDACAVETLSASCDLIEAASMLFSALRRLDASGASVIAVQRIPDSGLGEAINDRLRRAAAPR